MYRGCLRRDVKGCGKSSILKLIEAAYPSAVTSSSSAALESRDYESQCRIASAVVGADVLLVDEWSVNSNNLAITVLLLNIGSAGNVTARVLKDMESESGILRTAYDGGL